MSRVLPVLIALVLTVWAVIDCVQTPSSDARILPKPLWLICIVLVPFVGAGAWLALGRTRSFGLARGTGATGSSGTTRREPRPQPVAPDDDPDFLRSLDTGNAEHERLLRRWEEDLKRREGDLRGDDASGTDGEPRRDDERRRDDDPPADEPAV